MKQKMSKNKIRKNKADSDSFIAFMIVTCGVILSCITVFFGYDILPDYQDKLVHLRRIAALLIHLRQDIFLRVFIFP